jgi:hypothetical protein
MSNGEIMSKWRHRGGRRKSIWRIGANAGRRRKSGSSVEGEMKYPKRESGGGKKKKKLSGVMKEKAESIVSMATSMVKTIQRTSK